MKTGKQTRSLRRRGICALALLCAVLLTATTLPLYATAADYGALYEGWRHISQDYTNPTAAADYIQYDTTTRALTVNALNSDGEMLFLNREAGDGQNSGEDNLTKFDKNTMTDFVIEFDMVVTDYIGKAGVDGGNAGAGNGSVSLAFMGTDDYNFASGAITARIDYTNLGFMWRGYDGIAVPASYSWNYVDGKFSQWHWRFNYPDVCHVKVVKTGYAISMNVNNGAYKHTATLPSDIGLPAAGYVGLMIDGANVTITNMSVSNTTAGHEAKAFFFGEAPEEPEQADTNLYDGWLHISADTTKRITRNADESITVNAMGSDNEYLFLNHEDGSEANVSAFGKNAMKDFTVEFDMTVLDYNGKAAVDGGNAGAGGGAVSLAFMGLDDTRLDQSSITARIDYTNLGFMWRNYDSVAMPATYSWNYVDGKFTQWHWRFNAPNVCHVKVTKSGNTISMDVANGSFTHTATLPTGIGLPESGYIGLMFDGVRVTIGNMVVTNGTTEKSKTFFAARTPGEPGVGGLYEGWQHLSQDSDDPQDPDTYVGYDSESGKLSFKALDSTQEILYLNNEDCDADLLAKFGVDMMKNFTIEYDIRLDKTGAGGGQIGLGFMGIDGKNLLKGAITAGHTNDHNCFWWRGYDGIPMPAAYEWAVVGWPEAFLDPSFKGTGRTYRVVVSKSEWTISMSVNDSFPIEVDLPSDIGLPETGYIAFFASNADGAISDVVVTNDTTGESAVFFGDGVSNADTGEYIPEAGESEINPDQVFEDFDGWSAFSYEQSNGVTCYYRRNGEGALYFDGMDMLADFAYMNADYTTSDAGVENRALFGKDDMKDYTVDFDFSLRNVVSDVGALNFIIQTANQQNPGYSAIVLTFNGSATALKYEYADVSNYGLLPDINPTNVMLGDDLHHVTIEKKGNLLTIYIDGFPEYEDVVLPEVVSNDSGSAKQYLPESGFTGFWFRNAQGYIANVTYTNNTTGESKTFFEDYDGSLDFWKMGGGDTTNLLALTPERGTGVHGTNIGEAPDNTFIKYTLPLELDGLNFTLLPQEVTTSDFDEDAWIGFALTDSEKDYNMNNAAKSSGFLAQIRTNPDGSAKIKFISMLPDGDYGDYTTEADIPAFDPEKGYNFSFRNTDGGLEVSVDGKAVATLDWLPKDVYGANNYVYLTTTASCTDGFPQSWAIMTINGENAVDYDSGLWQDEEDDPFDDFDDDDDNGGEWGDNEDSPDTGDSSACIPAAIAALMIAALALGITLTRKSRRA